MNDLAIAWTENAAAATATTAKRLVVENTNALLYEQEASCFEERKARVVAERCISPW